MTARGPPHRAFAAVVLAATAAVASAQTKIVVTTFCGHGMSPDCNPIDSPSFAGVISVFVFIPFLLCLVPACWLCFKDMDTDDIAMRARRAFVKGARAPSTAPPPVVDQIVMEQVVPHAAHPEQGNHGHVMRGAAGAHSPMVEVASPPAPLAAAEEWVCANCTFKNPAVTATCSMCASARDAPLVV